VRNRVIGSVLVVVVGLIPLFLGGPIFVLLMSLLGVAGYREYLELVARASPARIGSHSRIGYAIVIALGCLALLDGTTTSLLVIVFLAVTAPLAALFPRPLESGGLWEWSLVSSGSLYLGLPVYAAIATRSSAGAIDAPWLEDVARRFALGWDPAPRGLAWALAVVLVIWVGDSVALLVGRTLGKQKLAPMISPNKTQEGALAALLASTAVGAVSVQSFGLGEWWIGLVAGAVIGFAGQIGDLAESMLKRQAGMKDSGSIVPGHGGVLDRVDALLFAFPTGFLMATSLERFGT
jgi:phosphatidate cytidylyltransferase